MLTTVHYLPTICFILLSSSFIVTYMISIILGHCEVAWPYISDTGVHYPESCIFSQLINIAATLIGFIVVIRYKQVEQQCRDNLLSDSSKVFALNRCSLYLGFIAAFGLTIVANFQELQVFIVHIIGSLITLSFGVAYCATQTRLSYYMCPIVNRGLCLARSRLVLTVISTIAFILSVAFGPISIIYFKGIDITNWKKTDGGYLFHLISSINEWISVTAINFFILSFAPEFKYMSISSPKFYMISTVTNLQENSSESDEAYPGVVNVVLGSNQASTSSRSSRKPPEHTASKKLREPSNH